MQFLVHTVVPSPLTIYKGIERLEPGTLLVYERQQARKTRYWDLNYEESRNPNVSRLVRGSFAKPCGRRSTRTWMAASPGARERT